MFRTTKMAAAVVAAGVILLAGCSGGNHDMSDMDHGSASAKPNGNHNSADVEFATMMIPHHQQALEMAELAGERASNPEVKKLAGKIEKAQDPEIKLMSGWLRGWGEPVPSPGMMGGHDMPGLMSDQDMKALEKASGEDFDRMFLEMMIRHHQGAVDMAETELKEGKDPAVRKLAKSIATSQTAEIGQMRNLLDSI
jgi:uncharacterized protein (DUF305 family)